MNLRYYRELIKRVAQEDGSTLDLLAAHMEDAAQSKQVLQAKGYGSAWSSMTALAAAVPTNRPIDG